MIPVILIAAPIIYFFVMNDDQRDRLTAIFSVLDFKAAAKRDPSEQWPTYQQWRGRTALANGGFAGQGF